MSFRQCDLQRSPLRRHLLPNSCCDLVKYRLNYWVYEIPSLHITTSTSPMTILKHNRNRSTISVTIVVLPDYLATTKACFDLIVPGGGSLTCILRSSRGQCCRPPAGMKIQIPVNIASLETSQEPFCFVKGARSTNDQH